ncbi:MAG: SusC/RagA family TonB-linked outer membrane protein [Flavobacteriia bacterium]|nr:SusC/RagA family TonB-linked outer membrane protein [Flavobacteriia bacterium]NDD79975.1 SusC/RagA family TonB-linked outer membrane protein [Flavobacteriia bacterium]
MKRRANLFALAVATFLSLSAYAQNVTGSVTDAATGEPLPSVSVKEKGTSNAAITNFDGNYTIKAGKGAVLVFSSMGYASQEVSVTGNTMNVALAISSSKLDEVVVTALGISRDKKSVGYAIQEVGGAEVNKVKDANFMSSLSGKVAGVNIRQSGTMGGSANVVIRGYKSLTGNNQALFVVDGIPISNQITNTGNQQTGRGGYDYGNAAMDINPEDIDKVSVLKGAAATALYGARAANGVILITTKKGTKRNGLGVSVTSGYTVGSVNPDTYVRYQNRYGEGYGQYYGPDTIAGYPTNGYMVAYDVDGDGIDDPCTPTTEDASFGLAFDPNFMVYTWESLYPELSTYGQKSAHVAGANNPLYFFEQSANINNSVAIDGGNDNGSFRLSATQFSTNGIVPGSSLKRNNFSFTGSLKASDKLTVSTTAQFIQQAGRGRYGTGYDSRNPNQSFRQWFNVGVDMAKQKEAYELTGKNITWNPFGYGYGDDATKPIYFDNPYFSVLENYQTDQRNRLIGNMMATYKINDWLDFMGRASIDTYSELQEERAAVGSVEIPGYIRRNRNVTETNIDMILSANKVFGSNDEFSFNGRLGSNIRRNSVEAISASTNGGLVVPGVYALSNSVNTPNAPGETAYQIGVNGLFAAASLGYKNFLYVDLTGRQDVSSTLPAANNTFFYPSATMSLVFSELIDVDAISFGKVRLNYAEVGADAPAQALADAYNMGTAFGSTSLASAPSTSNNAGLLPESTVSTEAGLEMMFFNNRVGFDVSVYDQTSFNQIMPAKVSSTSGTIYKYVNAGEINNKGIELSLSATPIQAGDFEWNTNLNWTKNTNMVVSLFEGAENLQLASVQGGVTIEARPGQAYGVIYGTTHVRDADGRPVVYDMPAQYGGVRYLVGDKDVIGNINPDWYAGWNNSFRFKNWTASVLLDMQMGGNFFSLDTYYGYATGIYDFSAGDNDLGNPVRDLAIDGGGYKINNVAYWDGSTVDGDGNPSGFVVGDYYADMHYYGNALGYARNAREYHVWDASFIKLREVALNYSVPSSYLGSTGIKGLDVALTGRNLAILWKNNPYSDPEAGLSAGNVQGYQSGAYPAVREVGVNVKLKF